MYWNKKYLSWKYYEHFNFIYFYQVECFTFFVLIVFLYLNKNNAYSYTFMYYVPMHPKVCPNARTYGVHWYKHFDETNEAIFKNINIIYQILKMQDINNKIA